ncbi:MAG: hypothetical protein WD249_10075 [Gaiellaceae bacterium]
MRAVVRDEYGGPDVLKIEEIDKPELVDDGVLIHRPRALGDGDGRRVFRHQEHERLVGHGHLGVHDLPPVDRLDELAHRQLHLGDEPRGLVAGHARREREELREHPLRPGKEQPQVVYRRVDRCQSDPGSGAGTRRRLWPFPALPSFIGSR